MIPQLTLSRTEVYDLNNAMKWAPNGTLVLNTVSDLTFLLPKYTKEDIKTADKLFERKSVTQQSLPANPFLSLSFDDERTSTLLTSQDAVIEIMEWSPMFQNVCYLAVLTNEGSVLVFKDGEIFANLTTTGEFTSQKDFDRYRVHSLGWLSHHGRLLIIQGTHSGDLRISDALTGEEVDVVCVCDSPIVMVKTCQSQIFAVSSSNAIYKIHGSEVQQIKDASRYLVYDMCPHETFILYTEPFRITKRDFIKRIAPVSVKTTFATPTRIVPSNKDILVVSNSGSVKIDSSFNLVEDNIIEPVLSKRLKAWNRKYNDYNTKTITLNKLGLDLNYNGNVLAVVYEMKEDKVFKYKIASERSYPIVFIPLENNFGGDGSSLTKFHEFKITGFTSETTATTTDVDYSVDLPSFIRDYVFHDGEITELASQNLIYNNKNSQIRKRYARLLVSYIDKNKLDIKNTIDRAVVTSLRYMAQLPIDDEVDNVSINSGAFTETFDFKKEQDSDTLVSHSDHIWQRCCLTFLPILTPHVLYDPATESRAIDISRNSDNEYGFFTKALLQNTEICIYSGCVFIPK